MSFPGVEIIEDWYRRRSREANHDLERPKLGESADERRARDELRPKTGAVTPSVRDWIAAAATGGYRRAK